MYRVCESEALLAGCVRRIGTWRAPPSWSRSDWLKQVRSVDASAAWEAAARYDSSRGVPLGAFLRVSLTVAARTLHRQEWTYALRFGSQADRPLRDGPGDGSPFSIETHGSLGEALAKPSPGDRWVSTQLFWNGATEAEVAHHMGVAQPAVSKRKAHIMESLRRSLSA
jgi:DNA-directed RNA polymerase specialized sigma24 family protein